MCATSAEIFGAPRASNGRREVFAQLICSASSLRGSFRRLLMRPRPGVAANGGRRVIRGRHRTCGAASAGVDAKPRFTVGSCVAARVHGRVRTPEDVCLRSPWLPLARPCHGFLRPLLVVSTPPVSPAGVPNAFQRRSKGVPKGVLRRFGRAQITCRGGHPPAVLVPSLELRRLRLEEQQGRRAALAHRTSRCGWAQHCRWPSSATRPLIPAAAYSASSTAP